MSSPSMDGSAKIKGIFWNIFSNIFLNDPKNVALVKHL